MSSIRNTEPAPARVHADLLAKLKQGQQQYGYVTREFMAQTARSMQIPLSQIYGIATFYSFLSTQPLGKYVIRICKSIPCYLKDADTIIESVLSTIGIRPGETTPDGKFSFELTNCIGACDMAPAMLLNQEIHGHLTPKKIAEILSACQ